MATGETKKQWGTALDTSLQDNPPNNSVTLSYEGKQPMVEVFATGAADLSLLWQNPHQISLNRLYYGDNLPILVSLLQDQSVRGKVQLVYIDPPFATNSIFKSRSRENAYSDLLTGAQYIEFLRRRLIILRELLAEDGSIYVHLDGNMAFNIKIIMDEIFGASGFRSFITRRKCNPKNYTRKTYGNVTDYILFYTKTDQYLWNRAYEEWTPERAKKEYSYIEEDTGRHYKKVPIHAPGVRNGETGKPWRGMNPPPGKHWQYQPKTLDEMDARGEIYWSPTGNPRRKIYLDQSSGIPVQDLWLDVRDAHNQNIKITGYPTEKPPELLTRIIEASSNSDTLVLDCFSGSGTTLAVASQLKRRWIGIDNSAEAIKTTLQRFHIGLQPMGDYVSESQVVKKPRMLPLFDEPGPLTTDFSVVVDAQYNGDLDQVISQWQELV